MLILQRGFHLFSLFPQTFTSQTLDTTETKTKALCLFMEIEFRTRSATHFRVRNMGFISLWKWKTYWRLVRYLKSSTST